MKMIKLFLLAALLAPASYASYSQVYSEGASIEKVLWFSDPEWLYFESFVVGSNSEQYDFWVSEPFNGRQDKISSETAGAIIAPFVLSHAKRTLTVTGSTNSSGVFSVVFSPEFDSPPNLQATLIGGSDTQFFKVTARTAAGCTVVVRDRTDSASALPTFSNVEGATVDLLVTAN